MSTDSEIIARSVDNPAAFSELYDRHARTIHRFAARRIGAQLADDILSETFLVAFIADRMRSGVVPADLRAAFYGAAALIPGVEITDTEANLDGRTGLAIGRAEAGNGIRDELIIDPGTGQLIGERSILTRDSAGIPAGTTVGWTAVTISVVDAAPAGGTQFGDQTPCWTDGKAGC